MVHGPSGWFLRSQDVLLLRLRDGACGYRHGMPSRTRTIAAASLLGAVLFVSVPACSSSTKDDLKKVGSDLSSDAKTDASKASTGAESVGSDVSNSVSSASSSLSSSRSSDSASSAN